MTTPRDGPNPLRPYYIPPSIGKLPEVHHNASSASNFGSKNAPSTIQTTSFGSSARNILADMDYSEYLSDSSPSPVGILKGLMEQTLWRYTSVFLAQPFEVAKTVLQVHVRHSGRKSNSQSASLDDMRRRPAHYRRDSYEVCRKGTLPLTH